MTTTKRTPWRTDAAPNLGAVEVLDSEGDTVADVWGDNLREQIAHARLIAAAPELLALLMESRESIGGTWRERRDLIIAKATGETP